MEKRGIRPWRKVAGNFSQRAANTVEKLSLVKEMVLHGETAKDLWKLYGIGRKALNRWNFAWQLGSTNLIPSSTCIILVGRWDIWLIWQLGVLLWLITSFLWTSCTIFLEFRRCFLMNIIGHRAYDILLHFFWGLNWSTRVAMQNSSVFIHFTPSVQRFPPNTVQFWKIFGSFYVQNHFLHEPELFDRIRCSLTKISRNFASWSYTSFLHLQKLEVLILILI